MSEHKPTVTPAEALARLEKAREEGLDDALILGRIAAMDPALVVRALEEIQARRVDRSEETPAPASRGMVTINYRGNAITAQGATRKNGGAKILADLGWYWVGSVRSHVAPGLDQADRAQAHDAATALREAGFTVKLVGPES
ncbi:MAG TPA: hypothetical protein VFU47_09530 [Armatimonadota bacterium]|nr:hypothetical protein [Armatimonadota bacterium]